MIRIWQSNIAARFIILLMLALILSQALALSISWDERSQALREVAKAEFLSRSASLALLLDTTPDSLRDSIVKVSNTTYTRFWIRNSGPSKPSDWWQFARKHLTEPLVAEQLDLNAGADIQGKLLDPPPRQIETAAWTDPFPNGWPTGRSAKFIYIPSPNVMGIATPLQDGTWLHAVYARPVDESPFNHQAIFSWSVTAFALCFIAVLIARGISRPLQRLAKAAERLGRGEMVAEVEETGPDDVRMTARAFNMMQHRIHRFVEDRTRMLAAIGHDLRTPLTSLRLHAEFVQDPGLQSKMLGTIEEIQTMTEAAIGYATDQSIKEQTRRVDLGALIESLCEDLIELGMDIGFSAASRIVIDCRPASLKRAVRNLIENGVRYGNRVRVHIETSDKEIVLSIHDDGPGVPEDEMDKIFMPFYRLESSRNRNTGGVGLGLAIARSVVRQHGGDIILRNMSPGLRVQVILPF